jgi:hypothetical protein
MLDATSASNCFSIAVIWRLAFPNAAISSRSAAIRWFVPVRRSAPIDLVIRKTVLVRDGRRARSDFDVVKAHTRTGRRFMLACSCLYLSALLAEIFTNRERFFPMRHLIAFKVI